MGKAVRIVSDEQAYRDMRSLEMLGKFHGGIAAYGMADSGDRLGVAAVVADCLIGDTAPHKVGTDVCRYAGAVDALSQLVHAPIDKIDHAAEQWITIRLDGRQKTVHDFYGAPEALRRLEATIETLTDSRRYTGARK